jgi:hypothetical protein
MRTTPIGIFVNQAFLVKASHLAGQEGPEARPHTNACVDISGREYRVVDASSR